MTLKLKLIEKDIKTGPHECELISPKLQLGKYTQMDTHTQLITSLIQPKF